MAITKEQLLRELKQYAPVGVELPRDQATNQVDESIIVRWAQDAAGHINNRRARTTVVETTLTLTADEQDYALPEACREVKRVERNANAPQHANTCLGIPCTGHPIFGTGGMLPSGQGMSPALDLIARQQRTQNRREDDWELLGGQLRLLFPIVEGEVVRVRYTAIDRDYLTLPEDRFELLLTYCRWKAVDWFINRNASSVVQSGSRFGEEGMSSLARQERQLFGEWTSGLNAIGPEAGA